MSGIEILPVEGVPEMNPEGDCRGSLSRRWAIPSAVLRFVFHLDTAEYFARLEGDRISETYRGGNS